MSCRERPSGSAPSSRVPGRPCSGPRTGTLPMRVPSPQRRPQVSYDRRDRRSPAGTPQVESLVCAHGNHRIQRHRGLPALPGRQRLRLDGRPRHLVRRARRLHRRGRQLRRHRRLLHVAGPRQLGRRVRDDHRRVVRGARAPRRRRAGDQGVVAAARARAWPRRTSRRRATTRCAGCGPTTSTSTTRTTTTRTSRRRSTSTPSTRWSARARCGPSRRRTSPPSGCAARWRSPRRDGLAELRRAAAALQPGRAGRVRDVAAAAAGRPRACRACPTTGWRRAS